MQYKIPKTSVRVRSKRYTKFDLPEVAIHFLGTEPAGRRDRYREPTDENMVDHVSRRRGCESCG